jgi:CheY-like chemotaxis protein
VGKGIDLLSAVRRQMPDLIVSDLTVPGLDGHQSIAMLRRGGCCEAPIVVLSGRTSEEDVHLAMKAGAQAYLNKPVHREKLLAVVAEQLAPDLSRPHVLVVEDEPATAALIKEILTGGGYRVTAVGDGEAALEKARAHPPQAIVTDIVIPGIDGLELITTLKRDAAFQAPILVLSARNSEADVTRAKDAGANRFLSKPVVAKNLLATLAEMLNPSEDKPPEKKPSEDELAADKTSPDVEPARQ